MAAPQFVFVSSVEGHTVFRPGGSRTLIGAIIDRAHPGRVKWDPEKIVAIPEAEFREHQLDYDRFFRDGALIRRESPTTEPAAVISEEVSHGNR